MSGIRVFDEKSSGFEIPESLSDLSKALYFITSERRSDKFRVLYEQINPVDIEDVNDRMLNYVAFYNFILMFEPDCKFNDCLRQNSSVPAEEFDNLYDTYTDFLDLMDSAYNRQDY